MKAAFYTLGCKVNTYESEVNMEIFKNNGYEIVPFNEKADVYVINTCSVTNTADSKSRKMIREAVKRGNNAIVVVMGCYSQIKYLDVANIPGVSIVIGTSNKSKILDLIEEYKKTKKQIVKVFDLKDISFEDMNLDKYEKHTRAFVKIQDGCNNYCTYCIIPYVRGNVRSKPKNLVIKEITELANNGYKEVVLTGIHTGHYGKDLKDYDFSDLLSEIEKIDGIERIRISSIEIVELDNKFMEVLRKSKKIVNHIHIPLQSGSDTILKKMNRRYLMKDFINKINEKKVDFTELHVFPYSKREGTPASTMPNQVDESIKKERVRKLIELSSSLKYKYYSSLIGKEEYLLTETIIDNYIYGHLTNYGFARIKLEGNTTNSIYKVKLVSYNNDCFEVEKI